MNVTLPRRLPAIRSTKSVLVRIVMGALACAVIPAARATSDTWQGATGTQSWDTSGNWVGGNIPGSTSVTTTFDDATFNGTLGGASIITIDANRNIRKILFTSTTQSYTLGSAGANGGNALLISNSGSVGIQSNITNAAAQTVNAPLIFQGTVGEIWSDSSTSTATMTFKGNISYAGNSAMTLGLRGRNSGTNTVTGAISDGSGGGTLSINKAGQNTSLWILGGTNTYTGSTVVTGGILRAGSTQAFGTNSAVVLGSTTASVTAALDLNGNNNTVGSLATTASAVSNGTVTLGTATLTLAGTNGSAVNFAGAVSGNGSLIKNGSGIQSLSGANTYNGTTTVNAGSLFVNGSITSAVIVNAGTFGGNGASTKNITVGTGAGTGAVFAPGSNGAVGTFTTSSTVSLLSDAVYALEFNSSTASFDKIVAAGLSLASGAQLSLADLGVSTALATGTQFTIYNGTSGSIAGTFLGLADGATLTSGLNTFTINYNVGTGSNDIILTVAAIPEPSTYATLLGALALAGVTLRRRIML